MSRAMLKPIGYWRGVGERSDLPDPRDFVDPSWNRAELAAVVAYLRAGRFHTAYMGYSDCRICGCGNGDKEYTDGVYVWPEGYAHYLERHQVKPPEHFVQHVLDEVRKAKEGRTT